MKYGIAIILTVGLLSACSSVKTTHQKESKTINQNIQPTPGRPDLTAPEVLTKVLDFLRHAQSPEDFRIETAGKVMNLRLLERTDGYSDFYIGNKFGDSDWIWSINFTKDQSGKMRLHFGDGGGGFPCYTDLPDGFGSVPSASGAGGVYLYRQRALGQTLQRL